MTHDSRPADENVLNDNQRRHFEVVLSQLEAALDGIEALGRPAEPREGLTVLDDDLPADFLGRAGPLLESLRAQIAQLAGLLGVSQIRRSRRRAVEALITAETISIDDSSAHQLRGYGDVDPRFATVVAPRLRRLRESLLALAAQCR